MGRHKDTLGALGGSVLALACVPRVSATIVIDESKAPESDVPKPEGPKPGEARARVGAGGRLEITRAEQLSATQLRLHFSDGLGPVEGFDPNDFRVSVFNVYINPRAGYSYAYYYDFGYQTYGDVMRFTGVRAGEVELDLYFVPGLPQHYCRQFEYQYSYAPPGAQSETGLFLHYAAGAIPVRSEAGAVLQNFGADWVSSGRTDPPETRRQLSDAQAQQAGLGLVAIECGPAIPPGPR